MFVKRQETETKVDDSRAHRSSSGILERFPPLLAFPRQFSTLQAARTLAVERTCQEWSCRNVEGGEWAWMMLRYMRTTWRVVRHFDDGNKVVYETCCPRQIRGPALKGKKMYGFGVRYLCNLLSRNRSGSNSWAIQYYKNQLKARILNTVRTDHQVPKDLCDDASWILSKKSWRVDKKYIKTLWKSDGSYILTVF